MTALPCPPLPEELFPLSEPVGWRVLHTLSPPRLEAGEVHLWTTRFNAQEHGDERDLRLLSHGEIERARRLPARHRSRRCAAGRAWLRRVLQAYTSIPAAELVFDHGKHGKPELRQPGSDPKIRFNYSDSGDRALCAVALEAELGVDLEMLPRRADHRRLAQRVLTAGERKLLFSLPPERREEAFLAFWTRKEAWGKALGVGIRYPLNRTELLGESPRADTRLRLVSLALPFHGTGALAVSLPRPGTSGFLFHEKFDGGG